MLFRSMKSKLSLFVFLLTLTVPLAGQSTGSSVFSKSFHSNGKSRVYLELPGVIDLKVWDNPNIRIEFTVSTNLNTATVNELANAGRYNLVAKPLDELLVIQAPNMQKVLKVKGQELKETITYQVFVPKSMEVEMRNTMAMAAVQK